MTKSTRWGFTRFLSIGVFRVFHVSLFVSLFVRFRPLSQLALRAGMNHVTFSGIRYRFYRFGLDPRNGGLYDLFVLE